jgi:hypothetical protein
VEVVQKKRVEDVWFCDLLYITYFCELEHRISQAEEALQLATLDRQTLESTTPGLECRALRECSAPHLHVMT